MSPNPSEAPAPAVPPTAAAAPPGRRLRRAAGRLLLVLAALFVASIGVEAWVRLADPFGVHYYSDTPRYFNGAIRLVPEPHSESRLFENAPGADIALSAFRFATDAAGLRAPEPRPSSAPDPSTLRLLFLGDSVTLGWGVDDAETWIRTLEREGRAADGRALTCLNAGHLQYNSIQEADWLTAHGDELAPAAVVLTFVSNDLEDAWPVYQELMAAVALATEQAPSRSQRLSAWIGERFRGLRLLLRYRSEHTRAVPVEQRNAKRVEDLATYAASWARVRTGLDRIADWCEARGLPLVVLDHGRPPVRDVAAWCAERGVPRHDFTFTDEEWARPIRNSSADAHANALGNRLLFEKAHGALVADGLLTGGLLADGLLAPTDSAEKR